MKRQSDGDPRFQDARYERIQTLNCPGAQLLLANCSYWSPSTRNLMANMPTRTSAWCLDQACGARIDTNQQTPNISSCLRHLQPHSVIKLKRLKTLNSMLELTCHVPLAVASHKELAWSPAVTDITNATAVTGQQALGTR